ncbi:MAG: hypothetical protein HZA03_00205 [Nitrospinae bacterium]|nr:hypothetical protein [Nitrospinota bacterium]
MKSGIIVATLLVACLGAAAWAGEKKDAPKDDGKDHKVMHGVRDGGNKASAGIGNFLKPLVKPLDEKRKQRKK